MSREYNQFSETQSQVNEHAIELIKKGLDNDCSARVLGPYTIVEYGCAGGKNSLKPLHALIEGVWRVICSEHEISIILSDLPNNDFNVPMKVINDDRVFQENKDRVFVTFRGQSFYERVVPSCTVDFGYSLISTHFLSKIPTTISRIDPRDEKVRQQWSDQAAKDWKTFLQQRAREIKPLGHLVVVGTGYDPSSNKPPRHLFRQYSQIYEQMIKEGKLTQEEVDNTMLPFYARSLDEIRKGIEEVNMFHIDSLELKRSPCIYYEKYMANGKNDVKQFAFHIRESIRVVFQEALKASFSNSRSNEEKQKLVDEVMLRIEELVTKQPENFKMDLEMFYLLITRKN